MMQTLIAVDQLINTLIKIKGDGCGKADETISARVFRCYLQGLISDRAYLAIDALFFWQEAHCYQSWVAERDRHQLPGHYRDLSTACPSPRLASYHEKTQGVRS